MGVVSYDLPLAVNKKEDYGFPHNHKWLCIHPNDFMRWPKPTLEEEQDYMERKLKVEKFYNAGIKIVTQGGHHKNRNVIL